MHSPVAATLGATVLIGALTACGSLSSSDQSATAPAQPAASQAPAANGAGSGVASTSTAPDGVAVKGGKAPSVPLATRVGKAAKPTASAGQGAMRKTLVFSDGVRLKITEIDHGTATMPTAPGNFPGRETARFTVTLSNGSQRAVDLNSVVVTATYGKNAVVATPVFDEKSRPFMGEVAPKAQASATFGFNIPASQMRKVALHLDLDGKHTMATFTGDAS